MKFVADVMLGRLARWLRILGHDTLYDPLAEDLALVRIARADGRILLTRDTALARHRGIQAILIASQDVLDQVQQVLRTCQIDPSSDAFSRCAVCNVLLEPLDRETARDRVPPYVYYTQRHFHCCPECGRVYWRGTHWAAMQAQLNNWRDNSV